MGAAGGQGSAHGVLGSGSGRSEPPGAPSPAHLFFVVCSTALNRSSHPHRPPCPALPGCVGDTCWNNNTPYNELPTPATNNEGYQAIVSEFPNFFQLPVLMLMLITLLNDGTLISIGYDNVKASPRPGELAVCSLVACPCRGC